MIRIHRFKK